jgi:hypothetical protein
MYFVIYKEDWGGLGGRAHVFSMMYEFMVGLAIGLGTIWFRKPPTSDVGCQVESPPPTKPVVIPGPVRNVRGVPELMHFWDF